MSSHQDQAKNNPGSNNNSSDYDQKAKDFKVNQKLADGPLERRKTTDVFCCLFFGVFLFGMATCFARGFSQGNPRELLAPVDADGNLCGFTDETRDYPHLYLYDLEGAIDDTRSMFDYGVCVKTCPTVDSLIECVDTRFSGDSCADSPYRYGTDDFMGYCLPVEDQMPEEMQSSYSDVMKGFADSTGGDLVLDIYVARWFILYSLGLTLLYTLIYIKFMDYCAYGIAWFSIVAVGASLVIVGVCCYLTAKESNLENNDFSFWLNFCAWALWGSAVMFCICLALNFKSLQVSLAVIETAADYFAQTKRILIVPIIFFLINLVWFGLWLWGFMAVSSIGEITSGTDGNQLKEIEWDQETHAMVWYLIFGLVWVIAFFIACNDYVIIVSAATWYFSKKSDGGWEGHSKVMKGFYWIFRYNLGSLAFGSLVISLSLIIRWIFDFIANRLTDSSGANCCVRCMVCACQCCVDCTNRFIRYLTDNAYIYMALSSESFCESAFDSFLLMLKNASKFSFVSSVSSTFMSLAKLSISLLTTYTCYALMQRSLSMKDFEIDNHAAPMIFIFLFSYCISAIFMSIFTVGANTILQCFLVDKDIAEQCNEVEAMMAHVPEALKRFLDGYEEYKQNEKKMKKEDDEEPLLNKANEMDTEIQED